MRVQYNIKRWVFFISWQKQVLLHWHILSKTDSLPHQEFTWATALDQREISERILLIVVPFYEDESPCKA